MEDKHPAPERRPEIDDRATRTRPRYQPSSDRYRSSGERSFWGIARFYADLREDTRTFTEEFANGQRRGGAALLCRASRRRRGLGFAWRRGLRRLLWRRGSPRRNGGSACPKA